MYQQALFSLVFVAAVISIICQVLSDSHAMIRPKSQNYLQVVEQTLCKWQIRLCEVAVPDRLRLVLRVESNVISSEGDLLEIRVRKKIRRADSQESGQCEVRGEFHPRTNGHNMSSICNAISFTFTTPLEHRDSFPGLLHWFWDIISYL